MATHPESRYIQLGIGLVCKDELSNHLKADIVRARIIGQVDVLVRALYNGGLPENWESGGAVTYGSDSAATSWNDSYPTGTCGSPEEKRYEM